MCRPVLVAVRALTEVVVAADGGGGAAGWRWWSRGPMGTRCARIAIDGQEEEAREDDDDDDVDDDDGGEEDEEEEEGKKWRTCTWENGVTGAARDMNYARCWR